MDGETPSLNFLADLPPVEGDTSAFLDGLLERVAKEMVADLVLLFGWDEPSQQWFYFSSIGLVNDFRKKSVLPRAWQSLPIIVCKKGTELFSEDISKDRAFIGQMIRGTQVSTFFGTTLYSENVQFGSLCIGYNSPNALTEAHREFISSLSKQIGPFLIERGIKGAPATREITNIIAPAKEPAIPTPILTPAPVPVQAEDAQPVQVAPTPIASLGTDAPVVIEATRSSEPIQREVVLSEAIEVSPVLSVPIKETKTLNQEAKKRDISPLKIRERGPSPQYQEPSQTSRSGAKRPSDRREREVSTPTAGGYPLAFSVEGVRSSPRGGTQDTETDTKAKLMESFFSALSSVFLGEDFSKEILRKIVALIGCDSGYLLQFEAQSQRLFPVASDGIIGEIVKRIDKSGVKPDPVLGKTLDRRSPILVPFQDWKSALKKRLFGDAPFASAMMIAICADNGIWGILCLFHRTQTFSQKELKLLEFVGEKLSFLLESMTNWHTVSKKLETMAMAQELGRSIVKGGSVVIPSLLNGVKTMLRASNCYLLLLDEQKNLLYGVAASRHAPEGISDVEIRLEENGIVPLTVKQNHYMIVENALSDVRIGKKWVEHFRSRSLLSVPLVARERVMGVLLVDETAYFRSFTETEIETVVGLAPSAAIAIDMAIKYQEVLQRQERQDHLSMGVFQTHEQEMRKIALAFGNGTGALLEQTRKQIKETGETLPLEHIALRKQLEDACLKLEKAVSELERISTELYPVELEAHGLLPALRVATDAFSKSTGVSVQLNAPSAIKSISPRLEMHLYRVILEALQNVSKHAHAKAVSISVEKKDIYLHLSILDQGRGFDTRRYFALPQSKRKGVGILGMKGRVELFGGTFFIESEPEKGTRVSIKVPLMRKGED